MQHKHEVRLVCGNRYDAGFTVVYSKRVRSEACALRIARKLRDRHCEETRSGRKCRDFVEVANRGSGECLTLDANLVPSVGELGYW